MCRNLELRIAIEVRSVSHGRPFREAWGTWLDGFEWDLWLTVTFRTPRQPHHAMSTLTQCRKVVRRVSQGGHLFLGVEPHKSALIHLHGLVQVPDWTSKRKASNLLWLRLFETFGRSQVPAVRGNKGASFYVSKYVTKEFGEFVIE